MSCGETHTGRRITAIAIAGSLWILQLSHQGLAGELANLARMERSYWLHASLAALPQKGYWGPNFPGGSTPSEPEVRNAARLLADEYAASRLYLIYNDEIPIEDAEHVFTWWRRYCPAQVQIVPTLLLRMYDEKKTEVFSPEQLRRLTDFLKRAINAERIAVYDVYPHRDQGPSLTVLAGQFPRGMIRLGLQPDEPINDPFVAAVQDTWSGFCHGKTNEDWQRPGFGAATLRPWVERRNGGGRPVAWNLVVVAWDYSVTQRGEYPGYDDGRKNMPLPVKRNIMAVNEILHTAKSADLAGFSSDLFILHANSRTAPHDGPGGGFYETLKRGEPYRGYYAAPLHEVLQIYQGLRQGKPPNGGTPP